MFEKTQALFAFAGKQETIFSNMTIVILFYSQNLSYFNLHFIPQKPRINKYSF